MNFHNLSASYLEREVFIKCYNQSCFILVPFGQSDRLWWKVGMPYNCHVTGFSSVQSRSRVWLFATPWIAACPSPMPEFTQTHVHWVYDAPNHLFLCHPLLLLPSIFPSIKVFFNESALPSGGQSIGTSASTSVLPKNIQGWFPLRLTGLTSLLSKGFPSVFSSTTLWKHQLFSA